MKRVFTTSLFGLLFLPCLSIFAADRVVNPLISEGNGSTVFPTIEQALAACEEGDRVLITSGTYEEQALSVGVGVTLMPLEDNGLVVIRSNMTLSSLASSLIRFDRISTEEYSISISGSGDDFTLEFVGGQTTNLSLNHTGNALDCLFSDSAVGNFTYSGSGIDNHIESFRNTLGNLTVQGSGSTTEETRCQAHVKDCTVSNNCNVNINGWDLEMVRTSVSGTTSFRYGNLVQCQLGNVELNDEEGTATETHRHSIIQNTMNNLTLSNDNAHFRVANNALNGLTVNNLRGDLARHNDVVNNEFGGSNSVSFLSNPSQWNVRFVNNTFSGNPSLGSFPNASVAGSFEWSYNTHGIPFVDNERENNADQVDAGHPGHEFYDPDGTLNDKGRAGGPFGSANFPDGTGLDAAVFDLELPSDFYQGISVPVEVKTHH